MLHIGLDDTDSPKGGCTTYVATLIVDYLLELKAKFLDYPNLIRLNPNTPWKTRGNAAVCLRVQVDEMLLRRIIDFTEILVNEHSELWCENTNPGVVFYVGNIPEEIKNFSNKTVQQIVYLDEAKFLINKYNMHTIGYKNKRGLIGATAAIGGTLEQDHTYELLTYRNWNNWGTKRKIDKKSIQRMDKELNDLTFNNIDEKGKPLITPHGPDPVLYGVRGETAETVFNAYKMLKSEEPIERYIIFRTNQGTDAHLKEKIMISQLKVFNPAIIQGKVIKTPKTIKGGHVILRLRDNSGEVDCAFYEPTGKLRHIVWKLISGDKIRVSGGVKNVDNKTTINIEKLEVLSLAEKIILQNPICSICGKRTESIGKKKGFRCKKCRNKDPSLIKETFKVPREIEKKIYLPNLDAHRHLTKPLKRYGKEKNYLHDNLFESWHSSRENLDIHE